MLQFRLGGKTITISYKGHKEEASVYVVNTEQYRNRFATDREMACGCALQGGTFMLPPKTNLTHTVSGTTLP